MPQLVPYFFFNEITYALVLLITMIYVYSKYILPKCVYLFSTRILITKL